MLVIIVTSQGKQGVFFEVGKEDKVRAELGGALRGVLTGKHRVGLLTGQRMAL